MSHLEFHGEVVGLQHFVLALELAGAMGLEIFVFD